MIFAAFPPIGLISSHPRRHGRSVVKFTFCHATARQTDDVGRTEPPLAEMPEADGRHPGLAGDRAEGEIWMEWEEDTTPSEGEEALIRKIKRRERRGHPINTTNARRTPVAYKSKWANMLSRELTKRFRAKKGRIYRYL